MKRCPSCNKTYTDDSLSFCIDDGSPLSVDAQGLESQPTAILGDPPPTVVMPPPRPTQYAPRPSDAPTPPPPYGWARDESAGSLSPSGPAAFIRRPSPQQTLPLISLIAGLVGITFGWICGGPLFGIVAVVLGVVALIQIKKDPINNAGKPLAITGLLIGSLVLLINLAIMAFWIVMTIAGSR